MQRRRPDAAGAPGACLRYAEVPCDARGTGWRGETRCARSRELRSDNRRENDGRCALRAPPVLLRFSAAHKARPRRPARAFADTVVAFVSNSPVFGPNTRIAPRHRLPRRSPATNHEARSASARSSTRATCSALRFAPSAIWCLQLVPSATTISPGPAARTAGNNAASPIFIEMSWCSAS